MPLTCEAALSQVTLWPARQPSVKSLYDLRGSPQSSHSMTCEAALSQVTLWPARQPSVKSPYDLWFVLSPHGHVRGPLHPRGPLCCRTAPSVMLCSRRRGELCQTLELIRLHSWIIHLMLAVLWIYIWIYLPKITFCRNERLFSLLERIELLQNLIFCEINICKWFICAHFNARRLGNILQSTCDASAENDHRNSISFGALRACSAFYECRCRQCELRVQSVRTMRAMGAVSVNHECHE